MLLYNHQVIYEIPKSWNYLPFISSTMACTVFKKIYFPHNQYLEIQSGNPSLWTQSVIIHETIHAERQEDFGILKWNLYYIFSSSFRLQEELYAIKAQMIFLKRHQESYDIERKARQFSSSAYLWVLPYQKAIQVLTDLWNNVTINSTSELQG